MKKQTFILEINDTNAHSWQGSVKWVQGDDRQSFRSVVEMLRLIDSAIHTEETISAGESPGSPGNPPDPWEGASPGDLTSPDTSPG